jgi:hypothetical protein
MHPEKINCIQEFNLEDIDKIPNTFISPAKPSDEE